MKETKSLERYQRQVLLKEFGEAGQQKLLGAKVVVIGAGGLGCPVLQYLVAAGVGTIGIVDDDTVSLTNLHRQPLYTVKDIGLSKAELAASGLRQLNPDINIITYNQRLTVENALDILESFDIIVDGTDNFSTRYMINDACVLLDKPLVYGAISQFEGQVAVFSPRPLKGGIGGVNYRDLFPIPPKEDEVLNCAQAGVLGVLPGIIGTMMANETIKLITGMGEVLINQLFTYNALNNQVYKWKLTAGENTASLIPADEDAFKKMNYAWLCGSATEVPEIDSNEFDELRENKAVDIIDVRELDELPEVNEFYHLRIPLKQIGESTPAIEAETVVVFCQSGMRSKKAVTLLSGIFGDTKKIYSLKGGIVNWKNQQHSQQI
ncbi:HesA/MoeB/ThiF family protein [Terrimonas pollutisoli]|uniref:HesA/MoeB/ThiF family protein n=1 Tax=Terrimonas pollutisoli TaxID=3034147 RepID=UPI0023EC6717|nr:HesA/MoeB/ThiF family protein [Terrimonas sp. H1YJ31]